MQLKLSKGMKLYFINTKITKKNTFFSIFWKKKLSEYQPCVWNSGEFYFKFHIHSNFFATSLNLFELFFHLKK